MLDLTYIQNQSDYVQIFYNNGSRDTAIQNPNPLIPNYGQQGFTYNPSNTIYLIAGTPYSFKARQQQGDTGAGLVVKYKKPSQAASSVQTDEFSSLTLRVFSTHGGTGDESQYPQFPTTVTDMNKLFDTSYSNTTLFGTHTTFATSSIGLNWLDSLTLINTGVNLPNRPNPGIDEWRWFSTEVAGTFVPKETGIYTFDIISDDGSDLLITDSGTWQTWTKPRNKCNFVWIMCMSGGAGGQGGTTSINGQGGGSAAITTALFPANLIPDTLFIWPGKGGNGGTGGTTIQIPGQLGGRSFVSVQATPTNIYTYPGSSDLLCSSGRESGSSATAGESGNGDSGIILPKLLTLGVWNSVNGRGRALGDVTPLLGGTITCPGADGGLSSSLSSTTGSNILSASLGNNIFISSIRGGASTVGGKGEDGIWNWKPIFGTGGAGGGGGGTTGGNGGNGAYGCGGGGGGVGSSIGGKGGNGGDGLVIIATF